MRAGRAIDRSASILLAAATINLRRRRYGRLVRGGSDRGHENALSSALLPPTHPLFSCLSYIYMKKKHAMIFTIPPTHPLIKYVKVPVEVFCSLRGCDEETPDLFRQLAVQTHRAFTLRVVVDSEWDEAWPVARKEVATANRKGAAWREATVEVLRDRFPAGGTRKSAALLQCLDSLAPETRAVLLVDGDQTLPPDYITSLVAEVSSFPRGLEGREELEKRGMLKGKKGDVGEEGICRCRGPFSERDIMARGGLHRWKRPPPPAPTAASLAPCCRPPTSPHSPRTLSSLAFPKP